jgi:hypothetical protein
MKKKGRRTDIPNGVRSREFEDLVSSTDPEELKIRISGTPRDILDRWVEEISGNKPDPSHETVFVADSLCRYIDGVNNWGDDPRRVENLNRKRKPVAEAEGGPDEAGEEGPIVDAEWQEPEVQTHTQAETPEGEEVMTAKKNGKKVAAKKAAEKKAVPPKPEKVKKEKVKKEKTESSRLVGKTSGLTRMAWFLAVLRENREKKLSDEMIDASAIKEFGEENIPGDKKTFTAGHMRSWFVYCVKNGRGGIKKSETFTAHNEK